MAAKFQGSRRAHPTHTTKTAPAAAKAAVGTAKPPGKPPMYSGKKHPKK